MLYARLFIFLFFILSLTTSAAEPVNPVGIHSYGVKIAILPFKINAPDNLPYLQEGVVDMLTSRITGDGVVVVEKSRSRELFEQYGGSINEKAAWEIGKRLGADYLISGSLTILGPGVSMDASLMDLKGERPLVTPFAREGKVEDLVPRINEIAIAIREKFSGKKVPEVTREESPIKPPLITRKPPVEVPMVIGCVRTYLSSTGEEETRPPSLTEGRHQNIWKPSLWGDRFLIKIRNSETGKTEELVLKGDGHFFLRLTPGNYEITDWRWWARHQVFEGRLHIKFHVPSDSHVYIGTLKLKSTDMGRVETEVLDEYPEVVNKFRESYRHLTGTVVKSLMEITK